VEGRPLEERDLVLRAQRGDESAFAELVRAHQEIAFRVAFLITGIPSEAEDAAQDGFVKAWRALGRFRSGEPWRPWLLTIVANEARNRRRSAGRRAQLALRAARDQGSGDAAPFPGTSSAESAVLAADERQRLLAALETLPEEARNVLACRYLLELSEQETAAALGLRRGTVKSRTSRALDRLRDAYE
jgi:RNA polymerase sigma-70 factor, ECF subfamily